MKKKHIVRRSKKGKELKKNHIKEGYHIEKKIHIEGV